MKYHLLAPVTLLGHVGIVAAAGAATVPLATPPPSAFADTESAVTYPLAGWDALTRFYTLTMEVETNAVSCVQVAFGTDLNSNGFSFPYGLERLSFVTLMSNGAVRSCLTNAVALAQLPLPVSVEPDVSSVTHGLTASNSYLFAWHDACVNREATNRTEAAIELFADGSISVRMDSPLLPTPHTLLPPVIPEGFVGQGQDEDWIRGNFALLQEMDASLTNVAQILDVGYTNWLSGWVTRLKSVADTPPTTPTASSGSMPTRTVLLTRRPMRPSSFTATATSRSPRTA